MAHLVAIQGNFKILLGFVSVLSRDLLLSLKNNDIFNPKSNFLNLAYLFYKLVWDIWTPCYRVSDKLDTRLINYTCIIIIV